MKGADLHAVFARGLGQGELLTKYPMPHIAALIQFLLGTGHPTAILRRIRAIVVHSIKSVAVWAFTHIVKKIGKRFKPSGANENAAPPIVRIFLAMLGVTAPLHLRPAGHSRCVSHAMLKLFASATFRPACPQVPPKYAAFSSANATAKAAAPTAFQHCPIIHLHHAMIRRGNTFIKEYQHV